MTPVSSVIKVMDLSYKWKVRAGGQDVSRPPGHLLPVLLRLLHVLLRDAGGADGPEVSPLISLVNNLNTCISLVRYFLSLGMICSGLFTFLFGLAYAANIHSLAFFISIQVEAS